MAVRITPLESGRFLVQWHSLARKEPACIAYDIFLKIGGDELRLNKHCIAETGMKEYGEIVAIPPPLSEKFTEGKAFIEVVALGPKNRRTKTAESAVYRGV